MTTSASIDGTNADGKARPVGTRRLGSTDVHVSEIALGTWGLAAQSYGKVEPGRFEQTVEAAWEAGITTFDVAPLWGDGAGERRLGLALGEHLRRAVIVDRAGQSFVEGRIQAQFDAPAIVRDVEQSLQRLGRDSIDVLLLHGPPVKVLVSDLFQKATGYLRAQGMVRCWGVSIGTALEGRVAIEQGAEVLCLVHNLVRRDVLSELAPLIRERGVGVLVRSPLLYGLLSGDAERLRFDAATRFLDDDHRSRRWTPEAFRRRLESIEPHRALVGGEVPDLATGALRYVLSHPFVSTAMVGARSPAQIRHAARASRPPPLLEPQQIERIERNWRDESDAAHVDHGHGAG